MKSGGLCSVGFKPEGAEVAPVPCCALCPLTRPRSRIPVASPLPLAAVRLGLPETALARDRSSLQWAARRISLSASVQRSCSLLAAQASKGEELARHMAPGGSPSRADDAKRSRQFRRKKADDEEQAAKAAEASSVRAQQLAALEEEVLAAVQERVQERVTEATASEEFKKRVMARLKEERAKLEAAVTQQIEEERMVLLQKKRKEQEEAKRKQEELDRILEENRRKVEQAQRRAARVMAGEPG